MEGKIALPTVLAKGWDGGDSLLALKIAAEIPWLLTKQAKVNVLLLDPRSMVRVQLNKDKSLSLSFPKGIF